VILYEKLRGLDFSAVIPPQQLGFDEKIVYRCSPSGNRYLKKLLTDLNITATDSILDIGCGKGSAIRCMLEFPFDSVDGVELSKEITNIALENFNKIGKTTNIFNMNALDFRNFSDYNMFYFYNPFPVLVLEKVVDNLISQITSNQEVFIIYNNLASQKLLEDRGFYKIGEYPDMWGNGIYVFSSNPASSRLQS